MYLPNMIHQKSESNLNRILQININTRKHIKGTNVPMFRQYMIGDRILRSYFQE